MSQARDVDIFSEALRLIESERCEYLSVACAGDEGLRRRVEKLLSAFEEVGDFLSQPAAGVPSLDGTQVPPLEQPGSRVGRYKLLQQIGEGGCGVVFIADQEEPVRRQVALKVIKPGMDTKSVIARFEAERQALALMDHPNIAHVFDAGTTASGRPYFVMELVRGLKITDYCDQKSLSTDERLDLFIQVCGAVQHAHQKGIIHRDLKPSNILITTRADGKPMPKVIDFGIAKATSGQRLTDKTLFTSFEMLIGTPDYMSPEQAELTSIDVDTRSDIYSLGVLLYQMLTGTTPFDTTEALKRGLDEVRRIIRDQVPIRPSTRLSTMIAADLTSISQNRHSDPPNLIREIRGDLDWIVMKALEKDRNRRYQTANGLAEDVRRFLGNEVVLARPPSQSYRFCKLIRRNKVVFGALATLMAILSVAVIAILFALEDERAAVHVADQARRQSETEKIKAIDEASRSKEVSRFLEEMLQGVDPLVAMGRDTSILKDVLDKTAARLDTKLTNQPAVQADLRQQLGRTYLALAQYHEAEAMLRQALASRTTLFGAESAPAAESMNDLGRALVRDWQLPEGEAFIRKALAVRQKLSRDENVDVGDSYFWLGSALFAERRWADAEKAVRQSLKIYTNCFRTNNPYLGHPLVALGSVLFVQGKYFEAEQTMRAAVDDLLPEGVDNIAVVDAQEHLAVVLAQEQKFAEAEELLRHSLAVHRKIYSPDHPSYVTSLRTFARFLADGGKDAEAEDYLRQLLPLEKKHSGETSPEAVQCLQQLVLCLAHEGKQGEAEALLTRELPPDSVIMPEQFDLIRIRRDFLARMGLWKEAAVEADFLVKQRPADSESYHGLAPLLAAMKDTDNYNRLCLDIIRRFAGTTNLYTADRAAKDCLIMPLSGVDMNEVSVLAEIPATHGTNAPSYPLFQCSKALAEYRLAHFAEATHWASAAVKNSFVYSKAQGYAILAMALLKSGQTNDALTALSDCDRVVAEELPKLSQGDLGRDWRDWIIARALQTEADSMINHPKP